MSIHSGLIHNTAIGIVQGDDYPVGAVSEARNMVVSGSELVQREPSVYFESEQGSGYIGQVDSERAPILYTITNGLVDSYGVGKKLATVHTAIRGLYTRGEDEYCITYLPNTPNQIGDRTVLEQRVDRSTAWLQVRETPPSGLYTLEIGASIGALTRKYTINIEVNGPDTITSPVVNMSDVPKTIGEGEKKRANPEYEAIWLERNAVRDADLAVRRVNAVKATSLESLAQLISTKIAESGYRTNPVTTNPYCNFNGNIVHLNLNDANGAPSVRFIKAPYWCDVLNNGEGSKNNLPQTGLEGFAYEVGGGLRYRYNNSSGWEEIPGVNLKKTVRRVNMRTGVEEDLLFNLDPFDKNQYLAIDKNATLVGLNNRNMIHSKVGGVFVSTTTNQKLYGPVSKNSRSKADGIIVAGVSKHAWLDDDGLLISTSSGTRFYEFGTDKVETVATGDVDMSFRLNGSFFIIRGDQLEEYQKTSAQQWEKTGSMTLPNTPNKIFRVVNGVLLVDGAAYLFTGKSLTGPMTFKNVNIESLRQCQDVGVSVPFKSPNTKGSMVWGMLGYSPYDNDIVWGDVVQPIGTKQKQTANDVDYTTSKGPNKLFIGTKTVGLYTIDTRVVLRPPLLGKVFSPSSKHVVQQWSVNYVPDGGVTIGSMVKGQVRNPRSFTKPHIQVTHGIGVSYENLQGIVLTQPKTPGEPKPFIVGPLSFKIQAWGNSSFGQWSQQ